MQVDSINHNPHSISKYDSTGTFLWSKTYYLNQSSEFNEIKNCTDSGFIVAGSRFDNTNQSNHCMLYRLDSDGDSLWLKEYQPAFGGYFADVMECPDKGFLATGVLANSPSIYVVKTDSLGNISSTLDVKQNPDNLNISIYPNPASNYISIVFPNEVSNVTFSIYDAAGRIVFEKSNMSGNQFNIDTYELTNGIYFLGAVYNERVYRSKIIVE